MKSLKEMLDDDSIWEESNYDDDDLNDFAANYSFDDHEAEEGYATEDFDKEEQEALEGMGLSAKDMSVEDWVNSLSKGNSDSDKEDEDDEKSDWEKEADRILGEMKELSKEQKEKVLNEALKRL